MPWLPIPSSYIDAGEGPGQIARRDNNAHIPGVPVIYHRTLADEVARMVALQVPSGWLNAQPILGTNKTLADERNSIYIDTRKAGTEIILNGYQVNAGVPGQELIRVDLAGPPVTGQRDDLVFLEAWFIRVESGRALRWRIRSVSGVNFTSYPDGLGDPSVTAQDPHGNNLNISYVKNPPQFRHTRDSGIYWAIQAASPNDPLAEPGLDQELYRFTWAVPIARVRRLNSSSYHPATNPNGAPLYTEGAASPRPDGTWADVIDATYHIVDLRYKVGFDLNNEQIFSKALADYLMGKLTGAGAFETKTEELSNDYYLTQRTDATAEDQIVVPVNLVKHSHFEAWVDGLSLGWGSYSLGSGAGTYTAGDPKGQIITCTQSASGSAWGISTATTNVNTNQLVLQMSYSIAQAAAGTNLIVDILDTDSQAVLFTKNFSGLVPNSQNQLLVENVTLTDWAKNITLRIYLANGTGTILVNYVDLRLGSKIFPVMPVTDGRFYSITLPSAVAEKVKFNQTTSDFARNFNSYGGAIVAVNAAKTKIDFMLPAASTSPSWLILGLTYEGNNGLSSKVIGEITKAWDANGLALVTPRNTSKIYTPSEINYADLNGRELTAWNPYLKPNGGATATLRIPGNGTNSFTISPTIYGRNVLWPVSCRIESSSKQLASVVRDANNNLVCTFTDSTPVQSSEDIYVDVLTDIPVVVYDKQLNSVSNHVVGKILKVKVLERTANVVFRTSGLLLGLVDQQACRAIAVNDAAVSFSEAVTVQQNQMQDAMSLTFATLLEAGTFVEVAVIVKEDFYPPNDLTVLYTTKATSELVPTLMDQSEHLTVLTDPILITHTKGTSGTDLSPDWGSAPFVIDPQLNNAAIGLVGQEAVKTVIYDIPKVKNKFGQNPLLRGQKLLVSDLFNSVNFKQNVVVEGPSLSAAIWHVVILATLVAYKGQKILLVCTQKRSDTKTAITAGATFALYEPNGRPLALQEF